MLQVRLVRSWSELNEVVQPLAKLCDLGLLIFQSMIDGYFVWSAAFDLKKVAVPFKVSDTLFNAAYSPVAIPFEWIHGFMDSLPSVQIAQDNLAQDA